jgi:hypothetical protein
MSLRFAPLAFLVNIFWRLEPFAFWQIARHQQSDVVLSARLLATPKLQHPAPVAHY